MVRDTATPYLTKGYKPLGGSNTVLDGTAAAKKRPPSLSKAMVAAAQGAAVGAAAVGAGVGGVPGRASKRKRESSAVDGLGLMAAAAATAGHVGGVVGPLSMFVESRDSVAGCKR